MYSQALDTPVGDAFAQDADLPEARDVEIRRDVGEWIEHEITLGDPRMRQRQRVGGALFAADEQQIGTLKQQDLFAPRRVADYLFEKDRLFAGLTLDSAEMALYEQVASRLAVDPPKPDLVVYLQAPVETLLQRIARRGIAYESGIDAAYLTRLNDAYARFFHEFDQSPLLIVNAANIDPVQNQADFDELVGAIRRMKKGRMYYNPLRHGTI